MDILLIVLEHPHLQHQALGASFIELAGGSTFPLLRCL